ncbi:MAG: alpha-glucan family phosphorylase [Firmicutes bacterium]|nr:alpha-glucan family phosphorylase [Bacillota bacterium]
MEYGLHESLPLYAGGLGILAGDYLKSARDLNLPVIGIGILWRQDYTEQFIDLEGQPYDVYPTYNFDFLEDTDVYTQVNIAGEEVRLKIWHTNRHGNASLYLLDAGRPAMKHGNITARLYGGGPQERIAQEIILGIGGVRALRALGVEVDLYHFNEGHAVLAGLELIREKIEEQGLSFEEAWEETRQQVVFTTHTPVEAGNEKHSHHLLFQLGANNGLSYEQLVRLGGDPFNMTAAALRLSSLSNGVSEMHGKTARKMWNHISEKSPIISITNGVHAPTWQAPEIARAYETGGDLWQAHMEQKKELINFVQEKTGAQMNPDALLVGFARRAAAYKRSDLIFRNTSVIGPVIEEGKLQLIFSGKAHPDDDLGKSIIKDLVKMDRQYKDRVVFLENYNMEIARKIVRGCDVWLNNPCRPLEASGTSGMKAALNGVLNLSVLDGWVGEGLKHRVCGWLLDEHIPEDLQEADEDERDLHALYQILLEEVIPTFYNKREKWVEMMKASIEMAQSKFTSDRMLKEYYERMYLKVFREKILATK